MSGLCFPGFFRLSGMTRVLAGLSPDLRARRRASVPFSSRSLFRFAISAFYHPAKENDNLLMKKPLARLKRRRLAPSGAESWVKVR
jgi:hypothetical protein